MGPTARVPDDVAEHLEQDSDLVEAIVIADAVEDPDIELGPPGGVMLALVEVPKNGFGDIVNLIANSEYANNHLNGDGFELVVRDQAGEAHLFPGGPVTPASIQGHLQLAYFGAPGDRRPLLDDRP
jgi:hypothetical protein